MPRVAPAQTSFNAGELSPSLAGRTDFDKYKAGCYKLENFIPLVQGPAERRPGTTFVGPVKDEAQPTWLVAFHFNQTQSYVIELGDSYARFFYQRAQLVTGLIPYQIVAPWPSQHLTNNDGTFRPCFAQSNDVMFWANDGYFPKVLSRRAHTNWDFRQFGLDGTVGSFLPSQWAFQWPFSSQNQDTGQRICSSATTGTVNLVATSGVVFKDWMVGQLILIEQGNGSTAKAWEPAKAITTGALRRVEARVYRAKNTATTGSVRPTHTEGLRYDGDPGVQWEFLHAGYGVVQIDSVQDAAHATGTVITTLPDDVVGDTNATSRWQIAAWQTNDGFPNTTFFFRERLGFARGTTVWLSAPGDFFNFAERDSNGDVTSDQAITISLASDTADPIRWARETPQGLLLGTDGGEFLVSEANTSDPLGPGNIRAVKQSSFGSRAQMPISVQHAILYVQRGGRRLREASYSIETESVKSRDLSVLSDHAGASGITSMAWQQEPRRTLWLTRYDGQLLSFTYDFEQDVYGWHRHPMGGGGQVESVCSVSSPDGDRDDLWLIVRRTIEGVDARYVEYLGQGYETGDDIKEAVYLDCSLKYTGVPATIISGLDHLEDMVVAVLADGAPQNQKTVASGAIVLDTPASKVIVGLPYTSILGTMRRDEGSADGTAQGKTKRVHELIVRFLNTVGGKIGPSESVLDELDFRDQGMALDTPITPYTGDVRTPYPGDYERDARIYVVQDQALPMTVVAIYPRMATHD